MWSIALSINTVAEIESFGATMYAPWNFIPLNPVEFLEQEEAELLLITKQLQLWEKIIMKFSCFF